jgi:hypothetical protein
MADEDKREKDTERRYYMWINPLLFPDIDIALAKQVDVKVGLEAIINYLCAPETDGSLSALVERYKKISIEKEHLFAAPAEEQILNKLVWPLRHAKGSYMLGNYIGTITLSGMVAEMCAILLFEISDVILKGRSICEEDQRLLFGSTFERLGQERRVNILYGFKLISKEVKKTFDHIRETRRKYLHFWSQDYNTLPKDASDVYNAAVSLVVKTIGQDIKNGKLILNPSMEKYLQKFEHLHANKV